VSKKLVIRHFMPHAENNKDAARWQRLLKINFIVAVVDC